MDTFEYVKLDNKERMLTMVICYYWADVVILFFVVNLGHVTKSETRNLAKAVDVNLQGTFW